MSPTLIFLVGTYIGACCGAIAVFLWWYRCDCRKRINDRGVTR